MDSEAGLLLSLVFSSIGLAYFIYGKRQQRIMSLLSGVGLMVFPYFVSNLLLMLGGSVALMALPFFLEL